ncbi:MAG: hypothetical protein ACOC0Q_06820, partial [Wenzhouxiangella sp.]
YLFISLPLVDAHVALYGYADLWLAGVIAVFAGLLVVAGRDRRKCWPLLAVLVLGVLPLIKVEGSYWLVCGIAAMLAARLGVRLLVGLGLAGIVAVLLAAALGLDPLALATAGRLSVEADGLGHALAGAARHAFVWFDWHLLVYLVLVVVAVLVWRPRLADRLQALAAFALFGLVLLWGFTPLTGAGQFLSQGTLFSRIILQFAPALIVLVVLVGRQMFQQLGRADQSGPAGRSDRAARFAVPVLLASAMVLWGGWTAWAMTEAGSRQLIAPRVLAPDEASWRMVEGQGQLTDQGFHVMAPGQRGRALLAVELPIGLAAADFERIDLRFRSGVPGQLALGWSRTRQFQPDLTMAPTTTGQSSATFGVASEATWRDPIYFLAVEQLGFIDGPWTLESMVLQPAPISFARAQRILLDSLLVQAPWVQRNPHFLWPMDPVARVSPVLAAALWIALTGLLLWLVGLRRRRWHLAWLALPVLIGWLLLDLRWQVELIHKAHATVASFAGQGPDERFAADLDGELFEFLQNLRRDHPRSDFKRVYAFSEVEFWRKRARYHLAAWDVRPAATERLQPALAAQFRPGDLILLLRAGGISLVPADDAAGAERIVLTGPDGDALLVGELVERQSDWLAIRMVSLPP